MIEQIRIHGLGVIRSSTLELGPGLTVLTGETGAGKTMVVTGLGLLLGGRADAASPRAGGPGAVVEGRVAVEARSQLAGRVADQLAQSGGVLDDGVLLLARSVSPGGRSRAHLAGRAVPVGVLADLADDLVAVHGQSEQLRLRSPVHQRGLLDAYAGAPVGDLLARWQAAYHRWRDVVAQLEELATRSRERAQEADLLRLGLTEVRRVDPQPGEDLALRAESDRLGHAGQLQAGAVSALVALTGEGGPGGSDAADVGSLLAAAQRALGGVRGHDERLGRLCDRLADLGYEIADVAAELAHYCAQVEADPARVAAVEERRAELTRLTRRFGPDVDAVLAWTQRAEARLPSLDDDSRLADLTADRRTLEGQLADVGRLLTSARTAAAARLAAAVTTELHALAMSNAELQVAVGGLAHPGPVGLDEVEFRFRAHPGASPRPLSRGASGGELSRVMLALEVVLAAADPVPTMVFDEVDAGIGGRAAVEVGRRLARLARSTQVLVVTHLPQVAAWADRHLSVVKSEDGEVTESGVVTLDHPGRVRELARMLAGQEDSGSARAHAAELLERAAAERAAVERAAAG